MQPAAVLIAIALSASTLTGCGGVIETIAESVVRGTDVKEPWGRAPVVAVDPPDASLASLPVVAEAARSVVKIRGVATACKKILEGSGVVFLPNRVMTNAHVVAGSDSVTVSVGGEERAANVVSYDPSADIAILDVPGLQAPPLAFAEARGADRHRRAGTWISGRWGVRRQSGADPRGHRAHRSRYLSHHISEARGVCDQRQSRARRFRRTADRSEQAGARHCFRGGGRRPRLHRIRADC